MHDLEFDLAYTTQLQTYSDSRYLQYSIQNKKHNVPELFVRYDSTRELMEVLSFKAQAKCVLDIYIETDNKKKTINLARQKKHLNFLDQNPSLLQHLTRNLYSHLLCL